MARILTWSCVFWLPVSPDGKLLATASDDGTVQLWLWQPEDLIKQLCSRPIHNLTWDEWQNYFEDEPYRKTCNDLPVAPEYQEKGKQLVKEDKTAEAARMIQQLNATDPELKLDQEQTLRKWTATIRWEEFEFVINKTGNEEFKKQRQAWVQALQAGQNPFTAEELIRLWRQ